jgi:hypothetical protein
MRAKHVTVIEEWQTAEAIETQAAAAQTKEYRNSLGPIGGSPLEDQASEMRPTCLTCRFSLF